MSKATKHVMQFLKVHFCGHMLFTHCLPMVDNRSRPSNPGVVAILWVAVFPWKWCIPTAKTHPGSTRLKKHGPKITSISTGKNVLIEIRWMYLDSQDVSMGPHAVLIVM